MLFWAAQWLRWYVLRGLNATLAFAFAADRLSETLLRHAQQRYFVPITRILVKRRKGKNVLVFKTK
jgi:hypothetical protein